MKQEPYLSINPMGKVPAIVHKGHIVTECAAICAYLADAFPDAGLAPPTTDRADYYRWLFYAAGPVEQAVTNKSMNFAPSEQQQRSAGYGNYDLAVDTLEKRCRRIRISPATASPRRTSMSGRRSSGVSSSVRLPKRDAFVAYADRITSREAYKRANDKDNALMPAPEPETAG